MNTIGVAAGRVEDRRLLLGAGRFVDDVDLPGQLWARVVRAQVAHAHILSVNTTRAESAPGVRLVLTGEDVRDIPAIAVRMAVTRERFDHALQPVLAGGRVRYVGEPVALVVADDPYLAEDAAELVEIEYDPLPVVLDACTAHQGPSLWDVGGNEVATLDAGYGDVYAVPDDAITVEYRGRIGRHTGIALEARGLVADWDPGRGSLELWGLTKVSHYNRRALATMLRLPPSRINFQTVDAGGGFGPRGELYPEDVLIPEASRRLQRPVKWIEDRAENLVALNHSRDQEHHYLAQFSPSGELLALRAEIWHDNGAYLRTHGVAVPNLTLGMLLGPYAVGAFSGVLHVVTTNKTPCGTYRAPGRYEVTTIREQLLDKAAHVLDLDPVEIRRKNLITREQLPVERPFLTLGTPTVLDDADYGGLLDRALQTSGFSDWRAEAAEARRDGRSVGCGVAMFLEKSGLGPDEHARVEVDRSGRVRVLSGGASVGQGVETALAQIAADSLPISVRDVDVVHTDSRSVPHGGGSFASRTTVVSGSAVHLAANAVMDHARRTAAELLMVAESELHQVPGGWKGRNNDTISLAEIAALCEEDPKYRAEDETGLAAGRTFSVSHMTYPYGVHLAMVEIDPGTGGITVLRYFVAYEIGRAINPQMVEGQIIGGVAQGLGGALLEAFTYDAAGQPQATTFMDYLMPTAMEMPPVNSLISEDVPTKSNPLGVKGGGEGGTTGVGAALTSAAADAFQQPGCLTELPMVPEAILRLQQSLVGK